MHRKDTRIELLRVILENTLQPRRLDAHPWTKSLIVIQAKSDTPDLLDKSPGQQLVAAVARLFRQMMPATPPKGGKRLDTRWGEFGILAAQYFSPFFYGQPSPASLRDAWGYIDKSILLFACDGLAEPSGPEKASYRLVGGENSVAANSTLSDWNRNGLKRLLDIIARRESYLAETLSKPPLIEAGEETAPDSSHREDQAPLALKPKGRTRKAVLFVCLFFAALLIGVGVYAGLKGKQIYQTALLLRQDVVDLQASVKGSGAPIERLKRAGDLLPNLMQDYETLKAEVRPFLWLAPWLKWVPTYGGDIAAAQQLLNVADPLLTSVDTGYTAISPLLDGKALDGLTPTDLSAFLVKARPQFVLAGQQVNLVVSARDDLPLETLSPRVRELIEGNLDPLVALMQDGLTLAEEFPTMVGASPEGPKTYLLLVQNEDELRPTGGFITAAGTLLMQDGHITSMTFENSGDLDDWTKPYPAAPWQLQQYMNSPVLVLRDTNWFTNYPTAALYAETLFSFVNDHSEDGVIAFDQQALVDLLEITGPVELEGVDYPIDSSNVVAYMRTAKIPTPGDLASPDWNYKLFMKKIADALAQRIFSGKVPLEPLVTGLLKILKEHHVLVQLDNPYMAALMAKYHWDGAVRPAAGDFLMAVDTNIGYNKTNAVVGSTLDYDVDLTTPLAPFSTLTVIHKNNSPELICKQWDKIRPAVEEKYPITDCYWNYLRVYTPAGTTLVDSAAQDIPANWMIVKKDIPAQVDILDEPISNIQAFGTLQVVPGGDSLTTTFHFALPPGTLIQQSPNQFLYHLKIQKQPGTKATPLTLRFHLPGSAVVLKAPAGAVRQQNSLLLQTDLRTDREIDILFSIP